MKKDALLITATNEAGEEMSEDEIRAELLSIENQIKEIKEKIRQKQMSTTHITKDDISSCLVELTGEQPDAKKIDRMVFEVDETLMATYPGKNSSSCTFVRPMTRAGSSRMICTTLLSFLSAMKT